MPSSRGGNLYKRGTESVIHQEASVKQPSICYTDYIMEKSDLVLILGGTFIIATGIGFYLARIFFGS